MTTMGINGMGTSYMPAIQYGQNAQPQQSGGTGEAFQLQPAPPGSPAQRIMEMLSELQTSDPEAFSETASSIAEQLTAAAEEIGSGPTADHLNFLASKFAQAAEDGDLSAFPPPPQAGGMGMQGAGAMPGMPQGQGGMPPMGPPQGAPNGGPQGMMGSGPQASGPSGAASGQDFMSQMRTLYESDTELFTSLMTSVADAFTIAASESSNKTASTLLNNLAARFTYAAGTGDVSIFQPAQTPMSVGLAAYQQNMGQIQTGDRVIIQDVLAGILENVT